MESRRQRPASASSKLGPPPNYLIEEARVRGERAKHVEAVAAVAPRVDNLAPRKPKHLTSRQPSKAQQARAAEVKRDNAILVHKLHNIMNKPRHKSEPRTVNLHGTRRKLATSKVARENNQMFRRIAAVKPFYQKSGFDSFARTNAERVQRISKKRALGVRVAKEQPFSTDPLLVSSRPAGRQRPSTATSSSLRQNSRPSTAGRRVGGGGRARPKSALRRGSPSPYLPAVDTSGASNGRHAEWEQVQPSAGAFTSGLLTVSGSASRLPSSPLRQSGAAAHTHDGAPASHYAMASPGPLTSTQAFMQHAQHVMAAAQASAARHAPMPSAAGAPRPQVQHDDDGQESRLPMILPLRQPAAPQASASRLSLQQQQRAWQPQHIGPSLPQQSQPPNGLFSQSMQHYPSAGPAVSSAGSALSPPAQAMDHAMFSDFLRSAAGASSPKLTGNASGGASLTTYGSMSSDGGIIDDDSPAKGRPPGHTLAPSPTDEQFERLERYKAPPTATTEGRGGVRPTSARSKHGPARPSSARAAGGVGSAAVDDEADAQDETSAPRVEYIPPHRRSPRGAVQKPAAPPDAGTATDAPAKPLLSDSDSDDAVQQLSALPPTHADAGGSADEAQPLHIRAPPQESLAESSLTSPHRFIRRPPQGTPTHHGTKLCGHTCDMQFLHLCCSCSDRRGWQEQYLKYVDGVGDVAGQSRGEHYCPSCAQHWAGRDLVAWEDEEAEVEAAYKRVLEQAGRDKAAAAAAADMAKARRARVLSTESADDGHLLSAEAAAKQQARARAGTEDALANFDGGAMLASMFEQGDEDDMFED